jgi:sirohydrochlorin ferrochelatase
VSESTSSALLLILHGSPRPEANEPALRIADTFRSAGNFQHVAVAYLECNEPSIGVAVHNCAALGITNIIAVPYFLHTGRHQVLDVPQLLIKAAAEHPELTIRMTDPVGTSPLIAGALAQRADEADAAD